jgi:hypothetical protein
MTQVFFVDRDIELSNLIWKGLSDIDKGNYLYK